MCCSNQLDFQNQLIHMNIYKRRQAVIASKLLGGHWSCVFCCHMFMSWGPLVFGCLLCLSFPYCVFAHTSGALERRCIADNKIDKTTCKVMDSGLMADECACLMDRIKCYPRSDCRYSAFEIKADLVCMLPIFESMFDDNCADYSDHMRAIWTWQLVFAWLFCVILFASVVGYFALNAQNQERRKLPQDGCIAATALAFTIVITFVWIGGMASLFFVFIYIIAAGVIYFGFIYGVGMEQQRTVDGSAQAVDFMSGKQQDHQIDIPTADVMQGTTNTDTMSRE